MSTKKISSGQELIVLVDDANNQIGTASKLQSHHANTPLHRAFSSYVFNKDGLFLATQRALSKKTFPGMWTNSCCGHPAPGENSETAVKRRLSEELGLKPTKRVLVLPDFRYKAEMNGIVENELCPVFFALVDQEPILNKDEVEAFEWMEWESFVQKINREPLRFSLWCRLQVPILINNELFNKLRTITQQ